MYPTLMHEWFDQVWNQGNESAIHRLLAADAVMHHSDEPGRAGFIERFRLFRSAFPDMHVTVHDVFEQGGYTAGRWTVTATHTGQGLGIPPTNRCVEIPGMSFARVEDGKAVEVWDSWDTADMMRQLGHTATSAASSGK